MIERKIMNEIHYEHTSHKNLPKHTIAANFYPVTTGIMIENPDQNMQMTVMNDRSQAGSVNKESRVELLLNRKIVTDDDLGVVEDLDERDQKHLSVNVSAKFYVKFTHSR